MGTDGNIRDAVHKELVTDPLVDAGDIVIEVVDGAVWLAGTVPSQAQCAEVVAAAHRVAGVTGVDDLLAVALPSATSGTSGSGTVGEPSARGGSRHAGQRPGDRS